MHKISVETGQVTGVNLSYIFIIGTALVPCCSRREDIMAMQEKKPYRGQ